MPMGRMQDPNVRLPNTVNELYSILTEKKSSMLW